MKIDSFWVCYYMIRKGKERYKMSEGDLLPGALKSHLWTKDACFCEHKKQVMGIENLTC